MKKILLTIFILIFALFQGIAYTSTAQTVTYTYDFSNLQIDTLSTEQGIFSTISLDECQSINTPGCPLLPIYSTNIELPVGKTIGSISTYFHLKSITTLANPILPAQEFTHSDDENASFSYNLSHYQQNEFEFDDLTSVDLQYKRGTPILIISMRPVNYNPVTDKLYLYDKISFTLSFTDAPISQFNREYGTTYDGGLCSPSEKYDYVIITDASLNASWQPLIDHRSSFSSLACIKVTVEDIDACLDYWNATSLFNDTQAHIREFIKDAYQDWETDYILLGGDWRDGVPSQQIVPYRLFTDLGETDTYKTMPCDLYYSNLDGNWYDSVGGVWGGGPDTGVNDKFAEIYIGRITAYNETMVQNAIDKIIWYDECNDNEWLNQSSFWGGNLGWAITSKAYMEELRLGTDTYRTFTGFEEWNTANPDKQINTGERLYHADLGSTYKTYFSNSVENDNASIINHLDHSGTTTPFGMNSWNTRHNTKPFFGYSQGCLAGRFSSSYAGCEQMMCGNPYSHAFALVLNTGYGYGSTDDTNSPSQLLNCYFWDYVFNSNETDWQLGKAQAYSLDKLGAIIDGNHHAWCYNWYSSHLFGDPAQALKISEEQSLDPLPVVSPTVQTDDATGVWITNATIHGTLADDGGENCSAGFEYGLTTEYGNTTQSIYYHNLTANLPSDWSIINGGNTADTWFFMWGGFGVLCDDASAGGSALMDEQLITPKIDCSGFTNVTLSYYHNFNGGSGVRTNRGDVNISNDGGITWITLASYLPNTLRQGLDTFDITSLTANEPNVLINFHFDDLGKHGYWWQVFNIAVSGTCVTGSKFAFDVTGLTPDTVYHYRSYATNSNGTSHGSDKMFRTLSFPMMLNEHPTNNSKYVLINAKMSVMPINIDNTSMNVSFYWGNGTEINTMHGVANYTIAEFTIIDYYLMSHDTNYTWYGYEDSGVNFTSPTWSFHTCRAWDLNGDGTTNYLDVSSFVSHYGETVSPSGHQPWDIINDGIVNYLDASRLVSHYGEIY